MFGSQSAKRSVVLLRHKLWLLCKYVIAWWLILQHKYWKEHFFSWQGILHLGFLVIKTAFAIMGCASRWCCFCDSYCCILWEYQPNQMMFRYASAREVSVSNTGIKGVFLFLLLLTFGYLGHYQALNTCKYW